MNFRNRPARVAAAAGAVVVAGAATMLAVAAGTASADEPGRCTQNVNIREEPDTQSRIVALCEEGTKVQLGDERDGWVHIDELGGWASKDFVKPDESSAPASRAGSDSSSGEHSDGSADGHSSSDGDGSDSSASDPLGNGSHGSGSHGSGSHSRGSHEGDAGDGEHSPGAGGADDAHLDGLLG